MPADTSAREPYPHDVLNLLRSLSWIAREAILSCLPIEDIGRIFEVLEAEPLPSEQPRMRQDVDIAAHIAKKLHHLGRSEFCHLVTAHLLGQISSFTPAVRRAALDHIVRLVAFDADQRLAVARELASHKLRTVRAYGLRLATKYVLPGFEQHVRHELDQPTRWSAAAAVILLPAAELQGLAWEIWTLGNRPIRFSLLRRGVQIPVEWVDATKGESGVFWCACRCYLGKPPSKSDAQIAIRAVTSRAEMKDLSEAFFRVGYTDELIEMNAELGKHWWCLPQNPEGLQVDRGRPRLPAVDNLSPSEDP